MPKLTDHPSREELSAYSLGQLPEERAVAIDCHISECEPCCETIVELSSEDTFAGLLQEAGRLPTDQTADHDGATAHSASFDDIPQPLSEHPRYEILGLIGKGGMGDVYKARHRKMERTVALKVINRGLVQKAEAIDRFHREVKAAAQLSHPNIVTSHDADHAGDFHFMVMEFVDGVDLSQTVKKRGALPVSEACDYIRQAAIGLQHAHERGMVHRDIKPHNMMVTPDGTVKILDFGLASLAPEALAEASSVEARGELTAAGAIMGTPDFISPEQADDARKADIRSDIYSLGATLYYLLSGRVPFDDGSVMQKLKSHAQVEPDPLSSVRDDVPEELVDIASKMMAKDPDERYFTPKEVAEALESFLSTWQPSEANSPRQVASNGGNNAGSGGRKKQPDDSNPSRLPMVAKFLLYTSLFPVGLIVVNEFVPLGLFSGETDWFWYCLLTSIALSTIGGTMLGIHQGISNIRDAQRVNGKTTGNTLLIIICLGVSAFLFLNHISNGNGHIEVTSQSDQTTLGTHPLTIVDTSGKKPLGGTTSTQQNDATGITTHSFKSANGRYSITLVDQVLMVNGERYTLENPTDAIHIVDDRVEITQVTALPSKPELQITDKTVNNGGAGLPSVYEWNLEGHDVGELKVRFLLAQNGKTEVIQEFDYKELPADFANKVRLQVKDAARSPKGRRVSAVLFVESPVPSSSATVNEDKGLSIDVEAPFSNRIERADLESIESEQTELLLALSYSKENMTYDRSMESMTAATKDGNVTFLFVTLDWSPTFVPTINGRVTERILDRMKKTYAECKSYRDSGVIKSVFLKNTVSPEFTVEYSFDTAYVRPDRFRFEIKDQDDDKLLISADGEDVQTSWDIEPGNQKPESLELAMAQAVGFTGGDVGRIPAMLMPEKLDGWVDLDLIDPIRIEDGKLHNIECFRLECSFRDEQVTLWVDKQSYLVRRIDERILSDDIRIERTTTYDPTIDGKITDEMLAFAPSSLRAVDDRADLLPPDVEPEAQTEQQTRNLLDTTYISNDTVGLLVAHPQQILSRKSAVKGELDQRLAKVAETEGLDVRNVSQIVVQLGPPPLSSRPIRNFFDEHLWTVVLRFDEPIDVESYIDQHAQGYTKTKHKHETYYKHDSRMEMWFPDNRTLILAAERRILSLIDNPEGTGPMASRMQRAEATDDLLLEIDVRKAGPLLLESLPSEAQAPEVYPVIEQTVEKLKRISLTVKQTADTPILARFEAIDAEKANQLHALASVWFETAKGGWPKVREMIRERPAEKDTKLANALAEQIDAVLPATWLAIDKDQLLVRVEKQGGVDLAAMLVFFLLID